MRFIVGDGDDGEQGGGQEVPALEEEGREPGQEADQQVEQEGEREGVEEGDGEAERGGRESVTREGEGRRDSGGVQKTTGKGTEASGDERRRSRSDQRSCSEGRTIRGQRGSN